MAPSPFTSKPSPGSLVHPLSKELVRTKVSWKRAEAAIQASAPLNLLTEAAHGPVNEELWRVCIRFPNDPQVRTVEMLTWLEAHGLPLSPRGAANLMALAFRVARRTDRWPTAQWLLDRGADLTRPLDWANALQPPGMVGEVTAQQLAPFLAKGMQLDAPQSNRPPLLYHLMNTTWPSASQEGGALNRWVQTLMACGVQPRPQANGDTPLVALAERLRHCVAPEAMAREAEAWRQLWFSLVKAGNDPGQLAYFDRSQSTDPQNPGPLMSAAQAVATTPLGPLVQRQHTLAQRSATSPSRTRPRA